MSPGHPDKVADYISESLLDAYIKQDRTHASPWRSRSRTSMLPLVVRSHPMPL
ncbi:MAG: hypothetical protein HXN34_09690 [Prevotella histicola]|nr:hypothetical protein [Prevotella histicola]